MKKAEVRGFDIVLVGSFNPRILTPAWFSREGILTAKEADSADQLLVSSDIARFQLTWMTLEVLQGRFVITTQQEPYFSKVVDLVAKTFSVLPYTPIRLVGLNSTMHYRFKSEEEYDVLADAFAKRETWKEVIDNPKLLKLTMQETRMLEGFPGYTQITIEPSVEFGADKGVKVYINDHYEVCSRDDEYHVDLLLNVLERANGSIERSLKVGDQMVGKYGQQ